MSDQYHLAELKIAMDSTHPSRAMPTAVPRDGKVLDIGCGAGQTLIASLYDGISFGVDIDFDALKLGRSMTDRVRFVCGAAERLPYRDDAFDCVIARVSLPYTNIRASTGEISRVLKKGGSLWMTLHPFSKCWQQARKTNYKGWIFFGCIILNSLLFHWVQRQVRFFRRCETFQTTRGMLFVLKRNGFDQVCVDRSKQFVVTARKR